jgi:hypothetical protein
MAEEWSAIRGWTGFYEVSNKGRVRSVARVVDTARGPRRYAGRILKYSLAGGRRYVDLRRPGARQHARVSRLVAQAFVQGEAEGLEVCHNDGNHANDVWTNLRWDTHASNMADKAIHGTDHYGARIACSAGHEYTPRTVRIIKTPTGVKRVCRTCANIRERARRAERRLYGEEN